MIKTYPFTALFEKFIRESRSGRRLQKNGTRIKPQSVNNYVYALHLLKEFREAKSFELHLYEFKGSDKREFERIKKYGARFFREFTDFLHNEKRCFDNYTGQTIKQLRTFINWINKEKGINTGPFHHCFYVHKEEIPIVTLSLEQLRFLLYDKFFEASLSPALQRTKDIFVFGCMVGLRFSDLKSLKKINIEKRDGSWYLKTRSRKTAIDNFVKLSEQAICIIGKYRKLRSVSLLPSISLSRLNANLKKIARLAGWTHPILRQRTICGNIVTGKPTVSPFCDVLSSHTMPRTSITIMMVAGIPDFVVRKISGHTSNSKSFYRYVDLAQRILDTEIDKMHALLKQGQKEID